MFTDDAQPVARARLALATGAFGVDPRPQGLAFGPDLTNQIHNTVLDLDAWLDGMHLPDGYGGPALNWAEDSLDYTGPGLDWRYEGIMIGYLNLWHATSNPEWLAKARAAGEDLVRGQLASGNFRNSSFEWNPNTGGSPHEAAACIGLLRLALAMRSLNDASWTRYYQAAALNIKNYQVRHLWEDRRKAFQDGPTTPSVSPDRLATLAEALFAMARLSGDSSWAERYAFPILDVILAHQVTSGPLTGAIHWRSSNKVKEGRFFPLLIARCLPGLLQGFAWTGDGVYAEAIKRSANFLSSLEYADGSYPQVIYANGWRGRWPAWVAGVGDILRSLCQVQVLDISFNPVKGLLWMLAGRQESGAIRSGIGFGRTLLFPRRHDPRDQVPSCGWVDKAFRFLTTIVEPESLEILQEKQSEQIEPGNDSE